MSAEPSVRQYVDAAIEHLRHHDMLRCPDPDMPLSMRDPSRPADDDWLPWRPIPSTVTESQIFLLQDHVGGELPAPYVALLKDVHFYDLTGRGIRFERHLPDQWLGKLTALFDTYKQHFSKGTHLVPFGYETFMDAGPVCFDFTQRLVDGDCPVVFWDHEWVNTDKEISPLFSSSRKMFECLRFLARAPINFFSHHQSDGPNLLPTKQALLTQFLSIDPAGAGGLAREYWSCWGVTPESVA